MATVSMIIAPLSSVRKDGVSAMINAAATTPYTGSSVPTRAALRAGT